MNGELDRRAAPGVGASWDRCGCCVKARRDARLRRESLHLCRRDCECRWCGERGCSGRVIGASERIGEGRSRSPLNPRAHRGHVHGAMVRAVAATARRQARILAAVDKRRQGHEPKDENQDQGEAATHLQLMVHEPERFARGASFVGYHRVIAHSIAVDPCQPKARCHK